MRARRSFVQACAGAGLGVVDASILSDTLSVPIKLVTMMLAKRIAIDMSRKRQA